MITGYASPRRSGLERRHVREPVATSAGGARSDRGDRRNPLRILSGRVAAHFAIRPLANRRGVTIIEPLVATIASLSVIIAIIMVYGSTIRSWHQTAALAGVQRDASLAIETMSRDIRPGSYVSITGADSLEVLRGSGGPGDSTIAVYHVDAGGDLLNSDGTVVVSNVDSLVFTSADNRTVNIDLVLRDDMQSPNRSTDDQALLMSSTVSCRN